MVVENGFKQTEVGVIPEEWDVTNLGSIISLLTDFTANGSFASLAQNVKYLTKPDYARLIRLTDIRANYTNDGIYVSKSSYDFLAKSKLWGDELLLANVGAYTGFSFLYKNELKERATLGPNMFLIKFNDWQVNSLFSYYAFTDKLVLSQLLSKASSSAQPKLNKQNVRECLIILPPLPEQAAIATALSDMDALIAQTSTLIEKKKAIKQGVMQELLRPKEGWMTKYLPEVCWFQEGPGVRKHQFKLNGVKLLNGTNIQDGKLDLENTDKYISNEEAFGWYSHFLVDEFDVLIACSGVSIEKFHEKVTIAESYHLPLCMNTSTMRFKVNKEKLDQSYFIQFLKSKRFKEQISGKATGSAQLNFGPSHVNMVEIDLPELNHQKEIGKILNDMEFEVSVMELKLQKLKNQKQGMMQALLTGKIRLV
jgi:type I restriction enzyme S subunit